MYSGNEFDPLEKLMVDCRQESHEDDSGAIVV